MGNSGFKIVDIAIDAVTFLYYFMASVTPVKCAAHGSCQAVNILFCGSCKGSNILFCGSYKVYNILIACSCPALNILRDDYTMGLIY